MYYSSMSDESSIPWPALPNRRLHGSEPFHMHGDHESFDVLSFWQWSSSNLCGNALRGLVAEYLVARALVATTDCRTEWDACDIVTSSRLRIEVKTSAYVQSWPQKRHSRISFDIAPKLSWTASTNTFSSIRARSSDVYVFAVHAHKDRATIDATNLAQWEFYVIPTQRLDEALPTQKRLGLAALLRLAPVHTGFRGLREAVERAAA